MEDSGKQHKKSIRFFNDREVRAIWDDENNCWWFSATDIAQTEVETGRHPTRE